MRGAGTAIARENLWVAISYSWRPIGAAGYLRHIVLLRTAAAGAGSHRVGLAYDQRTVQTDSAACCPDIARNVRFVTDCRLSVLYSMKGAYRPKATFSNGYNWRRNSVVRIS